MTRVKICGLTNLEDAVLAVEAGADALGLVFADSPRNVSLAIAEQIVAGLPPLVCTVGVFVDAEIEEVATLAERVQLDAVQLHGQESPEDCLRLPLKVIKRIKVHQDDSAECLRNRMRGYQVTAYLLDPGAGSGQTFNWDIAQGLPGRLIVSGGLNPENVGAAIHVLRPFAVDVSSGVEFEPGRKDPEKVRAFVHAVREADAGNSQQ